MGILSARAVVCAFVCAGAFLSASGLLQFHEVFFSPSAASSAPSRPSASVPQPDRQYDRLVVVLIDALRADMVLGSEAMYGQASREDSKDELSRNMQFTRSLLASGQAVGYVAHASVPTVTMPRLKALLSGKPPAFIDILKNFNSVALGDENVVQLMRESGLRIVFYGDDTWLKLFPDAFQRAEGTSGFYTRDTVEVDDNVTRHLREELDPLMEHPKSRDWDVLVLHYLGLDHVGHLRGPRSPMMKSKLREMDDIIRLVYSSVRSQDDVRLREDENANATLITLCSDHGMSEIGNHGGATVEESSALMTFLRGDGAHLRPHANTKTNGRRLQVDLVPTIAALFGLRIPFHNTGLVIEEIVARSAKGDSRMTLIKALYANLIQLRQLVGLKFPGSRLGPELNEVNSRVHTLFTQGQSRTDEEADDLILHLRTLSQQLQEMVARSDGSEYNLPFVGVGVWTLIVCATGAIFFTIRARITRQQALGQPTFSSRMVMGAYVATILSLSSTSSIENEHATVYFVTTSIIVSVCIDFVRSRCETSQLASIAVPFGCVVCLRVLRERSQVINFARLNGLAVDSSLPGNEFATDDSLSVWFTGPLLGFLQAPEEFYFAIIYIGIVRSVISQWRSRRIGDIWFYASVAVFSAGMAANVWCSRLIANENDRASVDFAARCVYAAGFTIVAFAVFLNESDLPSAIEMMLWLLTTLVQKPCNLPSLAVICVLLQLLSLICTRNVDVFTSGLLVVWISTGSFFALGNSHLVTTIDISQSYHGLEGYSQATVGLLTFVNIFSGPLLVFARASNWTKYLVNRAKNVKANPTEQIVWATLSYQAFRMAFYTIIVYFMRFHLFIWSVFAPKFLYEVVFTVVIAFYTLAL